MGQYLKKILNRDSNLKIVFNRDLKFKRLRNTAIQDRLCDHLGLGNVDLIDRKIKITDDLYLVIISKWDLEIWSQWWSADNINVDYIKRLLCK